MHQLRHTVAVARTGNFSRAAEQCRVAQPSLSQQIQKLVDELGERLFDRLKTGVKLTTAGELFLPRAPASSMKPKPRSAKCATLIRSLAAR